MNPGTVAVLGAGGATGRAVVRALGDRARIRAVVHRPAQVDEALAGGADEAVVADFGRPADLHDALSGVASAYLIVPQFHPHEASFVGAVLGAAEDCELGRLVYHSVLHPHTTAMRHHVRKAESEMLVRHGRVPWTILQPAMYAETVGVMLQRSGDTGVVRVPYRSGTTFTPVALDDVAEVAATVLTRDGHVNASYELAGPEVLTIADMVAQMGAAVGRSVTVEHVGPGAASLSPRWGLSAAADALAMWAHYDQHGLRGNSGVLSWLLGRPATTFRDAVGSPAPGA